MSGDNEQMDCIDEAEGYATLWKSRPTCGERPWNDRGISELSRRLGVSQNAIQRSLALLAESAPFKKALRRGEITKTAIEEVLDRDPSTTPHSPVLAIENI